MIAMSGGVDSGVALLLSRQNGDNPIGVTLSLTEPADEQGIADARAICETMGVRHEAIYAQKEFRDTVVRYFIDEYLAGRTPNPCVVCNRDIKFGLLSRVADEYGCEKIVTGHYARKIEIGGYTYIRRAADESKDQSYMLAFLSQEQIRRAAFPLGDMTKAEIRSIAEKNGLPNARKHDSQDICFVPDGDYVAAITRLAGIPPTSGNYVDGDGKILGKHKGYWCYTVGQRKGLGIALGKHAFVLSKDAETNTVVLGDEEELYQKEVLIDNLRFPGDAAPFAGEVRCTAKLRYAHKRSPALFRRTGETSAELVFDEPQRAPSPGQFAVLYDEEGEYVTAAGVIR